MIGCSDLRKMLEYVSKHSKRSVQLEWKKMKDRASNVKQWSMNDVDAGVVTNKGQYVVCGKAKRRNNKQLNLVKIIS